MNSAAQTPMIRRMTLDDLGRVMEITASLQQAPHWPLSAWQAALDSQWTPKRVAMVALDEASGAVNGLALASLVPPNAELESIVVAAEAQRRGVGRRLFGALLREFEAEGVTEVQLEVRASNYPALGLYRTLGFVEAGRRVRYYADPVEDALLLILRIG
jgi:ribosomal-protein-alanine N-acetyltransferase